MNIMNTSYFCENEIDKIIENYTQFCSQIEAFSETIRLESQSYETQIDSTHLSRTPDFQTEFLEFVGASDKIRSIKNCTEFDADSQTDFENIIKGFLTKNPYWTNDNFSNAFDFETYLECQQFFVTVKSSPQKYVERINGRKIRKPDHRFKISPQILFIADIHKIEIEPENCGPLNSERLLYGQTFRRVMFYGRCELINTKCLNNIDNSLQIGQKESLKRQYRVDDGSANVVVHFNQATNSRFHELQQAFNTLNYECDAAHRDGIPFLGNGCYKPGTPKCDKILHCCDTLIKVIHRNMSAKMDVLKNGSKICVIGAPFRNSRSKNVEIFAYNVYEDTGDNREMELKFKDNLIYTYRTKLFKNRVNGELNVAK